MVNEIYMNGGRKMARPVNNREEYIARRNAAANVKSFCDARAGDAKAKARQVQYNYGDLLPDGVLKGCCHPSSTFPHDIDCNSPEEQERIRQILIEKKDEIGLLELSGSANYGLHAVCRRQRGRTILECQVKVALLTQTEMDTSAHDQQRVLYTGPATEDNLFYLDDALFEEPMTIEESEAEYNLLKEREAHGEEEVPPGAKKANKHYRPWEEWSEAPNEELGVKNEELEDSPVGCEEYEGIPYSAIIAKWWELYNDGKEPIEQNRDMLTFELAVNLRHICGFNRELMGKVIPCYDRFPEAQKMKCIDSALAEKRTQMPKRLKDVLTELRRNHVTEEPSLCDTTLVEEPEDYYGRLPKMLKKVQTPQLLEVFNVVADYLMDCALYFFRERIENAFGSRDYVGTADRQRMGKNDSIFARLDFDFSFEAALQQSIAVKGANVSRNAVQQMLKNWRKQGLIVQAEKGRFKKLCERS